MRVKEGENLNLEVVIGLAGEERFRTILGGKIGRICDGVVG